MLQYQTTPRPSGGRLRIERRPGIPRDLRGGPASKLMGERTSLQHRASSKGPGWRLWAGRVQLLPEPCQLPWLSCRLMWTLLSFQPNALAAGVALSAPSCSSCFTSCVWCILHGFVALHLDNIARGMTDVVSASTIYSTCLLSCSQPCRQSAHVGAGLLSHGHLLQAVAGCLRTHARRR